VPRMGWTEYHSLETIYAFLRELEENVILTYFTILIVLKYEK
jgi:hypothetical protein